jgi:hypothetical protein
MNSITMAMIAKSVVAGVGDRSGKSRQLLPFEQDENNHHARAGELDLALLEREK